MSIWLHFTIIIFSLAVLVWSADRFVYGAAGLARNLGVSPLVIGLTIVAMGSSAPEMMAAASASMGTGVPDMGVGNAIGSNIANILLVLGITALLKPMVVGSSTMRREIPMVLFVSLVATFFLFNGFLSFIEGVILMAGFFVTIIYLTVSAIRQPKDAEPDPMLEEMESDVPDKMPTFKAVFWLVFGLVLLIGSAHYLVESAKATASYFGVSQLVIGLTIVAIGTSLPELAASIAGVLKGEDDLAIGNIIGSNIFNILAVMSLPALITPGAIDANRDALYMIGATILLFAVAGIGRSKRINRFEGGLLFSGFIAYQALVFYS